MPRSARCWIAARSEPARGASPSPRSRRRRRRTRSLSSARLMSWNQRESERISTWASSSASAGDELLELARRRRASPARERLPSAAARSCSATASAPSLAVRTAVNSSQQERLVVDERAPAEVAQRRGARLRRHAQESRRGDGRAHWPGGEDVGALALMDARQNGRVTPLAPGDVFGGFRIESIAGRGGMGVVYRAVQLDLGRPVALKLIAADRAADPAFRERFQRESRLAALIDHPNVVPVHGGGGGRRPALPRHALRAGHRPAPAAQARGPARADAGGRDRRAGRRPRSTPPTPPGSSTATSSPPTS